MGVAGLGRRNHHAAGPVRVRVEPESVAGPLTTVSVTGSPELEVAASVNGALG